MMKMKITIVKVQITKNYCPLLVPDKRLFISLCSMCSNPMDLGKAEAWTWILLSLNPASIGISYCLLREEGKHMGAEPLSSWNAAFHDDVYICFCLSKQWHNNHRLAAGLGNDSAEGNPRTVDTYAWSLLKQSLLPLPAKGSFWHEFMLLLSTGGNIRKRRRGKCILLGSGTFWAVVDELWCSSSQVRLVMHWNWNKESLSPP